MNLYETLSIINMVILVGIIVYHSVKKDISAVLYNVITLLFLVIVMVVQGNYEAIRDNLYSVLGEKSFIILRNVLSVTLFFGSSVTVSVQIIARIICFIAFIIIASKAAKIVLAKFTKKTFSNTISFKNDKVASVNFCFNNKVFLFYNKLLN